jgi:hypothetical protein
MKAITELFESWITRFCALILLSAGSFGAFNWIRWSALSASDWATWFGSVGTVTAVVVAAFAIYAQNRNARELERLRRDQDEAATLLALCYLGREVRQMCTLSGFQIDTPGNPILYPDISANFASIAAMIGALPIERVAARSMVGLSLALRRIALHMSEIYKVNPQQGDGFYLANRNRLVDLDVRCGEVSGALREALKAFAPDLYAQHSTELLRL